MKALNSLQIKSNTNNKSNLKKIITIKYNINNQ